MYAPLKAKLQTELAAIRDAGTYKNERIIVSPQAAHIQVNSGAEVINFCANNYLGLANDPRLVDAARKVMEDHGFGMASVRFICGTQDIHKQLESKISAFLQTDDTIRTPAVSMPMADSLRPFSDPKMPSYPINSITHPSSMASGCAKPNAIDT